MARSNKSPVRLLALLALAATALAAVSGAVYVERKIARLALGGLGESFSTRVYASPAAVADGAPAVPARLVARLARLGYAEVRGRDPARGEFSRDQDGVEVFLRGFKIPGQSQEPALVRLDARGGIWRIAPLPGAAPKVLLEPELIAELSGAARVRREPARAGEIPERLKQAVIAAEDKRFYTHHGLDLRAIARAIWHNLRHPDALYGGSTITQQVAKNLFLTPRRTYERKLAEAAIALYLELRRSKEEILTLYLNHIYLGQDGSVSVAGVKSAARFYFQKTPAELSLPECATIAGIIRSPYRYNPLRDPAAARRRRNFVLHRMREENFIADRELEAGLAAPLDLKPERQAQRKESSYYVAEVERELLPRYGEDALYRYGLSIYTTMDPMLQNAATNALARTPNQGALAALEPASGKILALAGGRDFQESPFNRATQARRQPGSAFKPFVYGAALEMGLTPASLVFDAPRPFKGPDGAVWAPKNFNGVYLGTTTLRLALAHSLNLGTLELAERVGSARIAEFARRLGVESPLDESLALALGDSEVGLLELVSAYQPIAAGGIRREPVLVSSVVDADGQVSEYHAEAEKPVLSPEIAFLLTSLLESVVKEGTARDLARLNWTRPTAGKTGTTNLGRDAWFIGYTPQIMAGVWIGDDSNRGRNLTGAKDALPVWAQFMKDAALDAPVEDFPEPPGIVRARIDPQSGELARAGCPTSIEEIFTKETAPRESCHLHRGGIVGWFKKILGGR